MINTGIYVLDNSLQKNIEGKSHIDMPSLFKKQIKECVKYCSVTDKSPSIDSVLHAIEELGKSGYFYDYVVIFQPTSSLCNKDHLDEAIELMEHKKAFNIVTVTFYKFRLEFIILISRVVV